MSPMIRQRLTVEYEFPVLFTDDVFDPVNPSLEQVITRLNEGRRQRMMVFLDEGAVAAFPELIARVVQYAEARAGTLELVGPPEVIVSGENAKRGWNTLGGLATRMLEARLSRHCHVVALGGAPRGTRA